MRNIHLNIAIANVLIASGALDAVSNNEIVEFKTHYVEAPQPYDTGYRKGKGEKARNRAAWNRQYGKRR